VLGRLTRPAPRLAAALLALLTLIGLGATTASAAVVYPGPVDPYASYQGEDGCRAHPMKGTTLLAAWIDKKFDGGAARATMRSCSSSVSEHQDGRAIDWSMDAAKAADRDEVDRFLAKLFATDADGEEHALARRMGIMYVIWNDHMYPAWNGFEPERYLSSSCKSRKRCSTTLRHRDHLHISLTRKGGKGRTSWYDGRLPQG
jgi:hypothetical protein